MLSVIENKTLCEPFGVPPATLSRVLANAEAAPCASLKVLPDASIRFPSMNSKWSGQDSRKLESH
ncbi:hypothetical protein GN244_ATG19608 [Phytophthora infestans]|uniref:Uncharacterized protein n=1 Tax=Phytophthora infestans TaxID=4787 RepID=A0A833RYG5_PHYIN|nr:hypothetical protein GN244_ATG19608 [Phytophthora infestans]